MLIRSLLFALTPATQAWTPEPTDATDALAAESLSNLLNVSENGTLAKYLATANVPEVCVKDQVKVRKEYSDMSVQEKLDYVRAVKCLMDAPGTTPADVAPGVRSRYDDFVATHVNQTNFIHVTGNFLSWHRLYIWKFEKALQDECGYQGNLPYWNYAKSSQDLLNSPYLDGSNTSQSGNGEYVPHGESPGLPSGLLNIQPGSGGGCVENGPYANMVANVSATLPACSYCNTTVGVFLSYEPRCLKRDISDALGQAWANDSMIADLLNNPLYQTDIGAFQDRLEYTGTDTVGWYGLHAYGHFAVNGDPSGDGYNSPNEPLFWLHHGQVDRLWWIWQNQRPLERAFQINGTRTLGNSPPSADATIEDLINVGFVDGEYEEGLAIKNYVSTMGGPLCYIYA